MNWWQIVILVVSYIVMVAGIVGAIIPALPGVPLVMAGVFLFAAVTKFQIISYITVIILAIITLLAIGLDYLASAYGAKRYGGTKWGIIGAVIGLVAGMFFGIPGMIAGPIMGSIMFEIVLAKRDLEGSVQSGFGAVLGFLAGSVFKFVLAVVMLVIFTWALIYK